ncbi:IS4 family transposase [Dysgonomonas sp. 521]|uniref:IS4 family transposase n=1 Tax=Dysgonomonas sp. 521 TaxID=2302932 RepID=UPI0013D4D167|nr:IS4 family transposase [Dysgonomonas sp. 521]NDV94207.1 IS4 family transposase [Dysgonomonas sp. 521]
MNVGKTVFAQLMSFLPDYEFNKCVTKYKGNYKVRTFTCREHFYVMSFAQLTYRESLRDIEACLKALSNKLYHSGIKRAVSKSTLAEANENRDWRIYADFAQVLIIEARKLYKTDNDFLLDVDNMAYALDSTTIDLCLSLFPWARFRKAKGAVKAHVLLDLRGSIPTFIEITDGSVHDVNILDHITIEPGAIYVMDRGYLDLDRLYNMDQKGAFFITRAKSNTAMIRVYSRSVDKSTGLRCDQSVRFKSHYSKKDYPQLIRRIKFIDEETSNTYIFLTNNFELDALLITQLYKERWKVELFFKWIKQHLRIKTFYGTSYNAVCCQIWTAVCTYLLVAIAKKRLGLEHSLYTLLQIFSLTLFEKVPIDELFTKNNYKSISPGDDKQLKLFDL